MERVLQIAFALLISLATGCGHLRIVAASNARDCGESIRTRFRYNLIGDYGTGLDKSYALVNLQKSQPGVFSPDGIPVRLSQKDTLSQDAEIDQMSGFFSLITLGIVPMVTKGHVHRRGALSIAGRSVGTVDICAHADSAVQIPIFFFMPLPTPLLVFAGDGDTCIASGKKFVEHKYGPAEAYSLQYHGVDEKAMVYGIASRLKEAEDSGMIDERFVTLMTAQQSLTDAAVTRNKVVADAMERHGALTRSAKSTATALPFKTVRCDLERGGDFAYLFALRRGDGGAATMSDYAVIRNAFRSAIRSRYVASHPNVNPRALIIDFTEYALKDGVVVGRVAVLTISPESMSYDSARRRGVVRIRIGEGQLEDARRWIRRNLAELAMRRNMAQDADAVPAGARFYSESETMKDGVLEISFRTE